MGDAARAFIAIGGLVIVAVVVGLIPFALWHVLRPAEEDESERGGTDG